MPDLAAVLRHATRSGAKVVITGDHAQLAAVEAGGGMALLARKLGHAQLTEAFRFRSQWEETASLAIRAGDVSALATYDMHGRLHAGSYEDMAEHAARAYLTVYLAGTDVILTAFEHRECVDLSRRVQGYLLDWDQIQAGATAALREGAHAHVGDLIIARQDDNHLDAGQPGPTLAHGDRLQVRAISDAGLTVSRLIRPNPAAVATTWSAPFTITRSYAQTQCDLGYAQTWHTVEGQTVSAAITLANDQRTRQGLYVGLSRGADRNEVYAYPSAQEESGSQGPAPDPEVARQRA
jgi:ATP-dependent exoDNAse (exonuclease V) alpha subunit